MKEKQKPPYFFRRFLSWFCHTDFHEELAGDLEETFIDNIEKKGHSYANWMYRKEVILLLRPSVIKSIRFSFLSGQSIDLLRNHTKIATRNLMRHRLFSSINILGLAASMSLGLIVIGMINDLLKFDEFHEQKESIYRVISNVSSGQWHNETATCVMPLANHIREEVSGIEEIVRVQKRFRGEVKANEKALSLNGYFTDPGFLKIFTFPLLYGNQSEALNDPFSIVITKDVMNRVFDGKNPIGQEMQVGDFGSFKVSGVLADIPKYSHLQFEMLGSISSLPSLEKEGKIYSVLDRWDEFSSSYLYLMLAPERKPKDVVGAINQIGKTSYQQFESLRANFELQALASIVPGKDLSDQIGPKMMVLPILILSFIAFIILLSACFNYTNLSIARAMRRSKEVGIRKVVGATRWQVASQFLIEAMVITLLALFFSIGIFKIIKPGFLQTVPNAEKLLNLNLDFKLFLYFLSFALLAGLMAGIMPATVLSKMHPANLVKNYYPQRLLKRLSIRKALMVFQFAISLFFIGAGTIAYQQYRFALHRDMGFDQENILNIDLQGTDPQLVKNELSKLSNVTDISFSSTIPGTGVKNFSWIKTAEMEDSIGSSYISIDHKYLPNHNIELLLGQNFKSEKPSNISNQIIINEQMSKIFDWQYEEALGQVLMVNALPHQVIGVVKDFHYNHIEEPIKGFFFHYRPEQFAYANLKIKSQNMPETMTRLKQSWKQVNPIHDFKALFLKEQIEMAYHFLVDILKIFGFLAFIAIAIACLGLLGMAVYTIEVKMKEISIRKLFGASEWQVISILFSNFAKMLLLAAFITLPIIYLLFDQVVLQQFAYRINIGIVELGLGIIVLLLIGLLTIGSQTFKAARVNPAEILKGD